MTSDAEAKARALVSTAESEARRIANAEQRRVAAEVAELTSKREVLRADVDKLEHFAADYRERLRRAIDAEVERLGASAVAAVEPPPGPQLLGQLPALAALDPGPVLADLGEAPGV
jgi:hypothetical protein